MHIYVPGYTWKTSNRNMLHLILDVAIKMTVIRKKEHIMQWVLSTSNILLKCTLSDVKAPNHLNIFI